MSNPSFLQYKISSKLPKLLGRDSVSTEIQALFELVKNSYDADASQVKIVFNNFDLYNEARKRLGHRYNELITDLKTKKPDLPITELDKLAKEDPHYTKQFEYVKEIFQRTSIIIEDNGKGMSLEELQRKWMMIGVSKESDEIITSEKRRAVGEKGVGRFAIERLSHQTRITSKVRDSEAALILYTNWDEFENSDKTVNEIKIPLDYAPKKSNEHGLTIELINLRDIWTVPKIKKIIDELSLLILPEEIDPTLPFKITVQYEKEGKKEIVNVGGSLLKHAPYHFVAELTPHSTIRFLEVEYMKKKIIPNPQGLKFTNLVEEFPFLDENEKISIAKCGPARFTYHGFPFDPSGRDLGWTRWYGETRAAKIQEDVEEYGGIKIYRDGFRVRPYGEKGNDWLLLGSEARTTAGKLPNKNVIGWVTISIDTNKEIIDTTTREKIVENEAFDDLKRFLKQAMAVFYKFTESRRQDILKKEAQKDVPKFVKKLRDRVVENAAISALEKKTILSTLDKIQSHFVKQEERVTIEKEALMDEKNAYRNLAALGITTGVVSHEIQDFLKAILLHTGILKREAGRGKLDLERLKKSLETIEPSVLNLRSYMALVSSFSSAMASRKKEFRQKKNLNLHNEIRIMIKSLKGIFDRWEIHVENKIPHDFPRPRMYQADLQSIFLNLFSNSIKSLKLLSDERHNTKVKNTIQISAKKNDNFLTIIYSDNGIGIAPMDRPFIFDLFWTRTASQETIKSGSGLGMPIITEIIHDYSGDIMIENKSEFKTGVTFKITFPKKGITSNVK